MYYHDQWQTFIHLLIYLLTPATIYNTWQTFIYLLSCSTSNNAIEDYYNSDLPRIQETTTVTALTESWQSSNLSAMKFPPSYDFETTPFTAHPNIIQSSQTRNSEWETHWTSKHISTEQPTSITGMCQHSIVNCCCYTYHETPTKYTMPFLILILSVFPVPMPTFLPPVFLFIANLSSVITLQILSLN